MRQLRGVDYPSTISGLGALDLGGATRTFNIYNHINSGGDLQISSIIQNGGIIKTQTGILTLSGVNTYAGGTTVNAGTLTVSSAGTLGATTGALAVNNPNTGAGTAVVLNLNSAQTVGAVSGTLATPSSGTNTATINLTGVGTSYLQSIDRYAIRRRPRQHRRANQVGRRYAHSDRDKHRQWHNYR